MDSTDSVRHGQNKLQTIVFPTLLITAFITCIAYSIYVSAVSYAQGDPRGSLLLSQTIVQEGTVKLDSHAIVVQDFGHLIRKKNGHIYYYFPIGSALYSVPFVAAANLFGQDMRDRYDENRLQIVLAAFLGITTFLLLYIIAQSLTGQLVGSALLAALFWFGSGYSSTAGTALWSHDWASVLSLLAVALTIRAYKLGGAPHCALIALFLFSAYLCRPTLALLSPTMIILLYTVNRIAAIKVAAFVFALLGLFSLWSLYEFEQPLPDYYLPKRLNGSHFGEALAGNLFSPSRGLFVFMPYLVVPLLFWRRSASTLRENKALLIVLCWPIIHLISISKFPHWWGGYSYGPRLMIDVIPALFLFFCLFAKDLRRNSLAIALIVSLGLMAVYINWYQGLFNVYAYQWNVQPGVDQNPNTIWNWRYPQFLHNETRHNQRDKDYQLGNLNPVSSGELLDFQDEDLAFIGWHSPWPTHRLSRGGASEIYFRIRNDDTYRGELRLKTGFVGQQQVSVTLNGEEIASFEGAGSAPIEHIMPFDPTLLTSRQTNIIRLEFSDASSPARGQHFHLAVALESIVIN